MVPTPSSWLKWIRGFEARAAHWCRAAECRLTSCSVLPTLSPPRHVWCVLGTGPAGQAGRQPKNPGSDGVPCVAPEASLQEVVCLRLQDLLSWKTRIPPLQKEHVLTRDLEERGGREDSLLFSLWISRKHPSLGCTSRPVAINMKPTVLILNYCPV